MLLPLEETVYIVLVSPGGRYSVGLEIIEVLKSLPNTQLICKYCGSMAGQIFAASGLKRLVINKSRLMMHEMVLPRFTAEMAKYPQLSERLIHNSEAFNAVMYNMIGITKEQYEAKIIGKDWELSGKDIIKHNLADELVRLDCHFLTSEALPDTCSE